MSDIPLPERHRNRYPKSKLLSLNYHYTFDGVQSVKLNQTPRPAYPAVVVIAPRHSNPGLPIADPAHPPEIGTLCFSSFVGQAHYFIASIIVLHLEDQTCESLVKYCRENSSYLIFSNRPDIVVELSDLIKPFIDRPYIYDKSITAALRQVVYGARPADQRNSPPKTPKTYSRNRHSRVVRASSDRSEESLWDSKNSTAVQFAVSANLRGIEPAPGVIPRRALDRE